MQRFYVICAVDISGLLIGDFRLDDSRVLDAVMIIKEEYVLFAIEVMRSLLIVFIELFEDLGDIFYFFVYVDDLVGENGVLVFEAFYLVGVELLRLF